ncbi:MAG: EamA family transporter [Aeromicrobium erythreum]
MVATAVAVIGLLLLAGVGVGAGTGASSVDALGLAGSLGAGLSYAVYTLASKRLLDAGWTGAATMGAVFGAAAVLGLGVLLATDLGWLASGSGVATVLWLGLVTVTVAYLLFAAGLAALPAPTVSTLTLAEPVTATLLGLVVLGEQLDLASWLGLVAIGLGIVVLAVRPRRPVAVVPA